MQRPVRLPELIRKTQSRIMLRLDRCVLLFQRRLLLLRLSNALTSTAQRITISHSINASVISTRHGEEAKTQTTERQPQQFRQIVN